MPTEPLGTRAQHLHAAAAPRQAQEREARFRSYHPVHPQGVVHQHALGPAGDGQHAGRRIAAQQRRLHPQVALDLLRGGDGAAAREGPGGRRGAHEELGEVRRGGVESLSVRSERTVMSCSSPMLPAAKLASSVPSSARMVVVAFLICKSDAALCSRGVWTKLVAVRELTVRSAVGATPGAFSRAVTRPSMDVTVLPRELKVATRG